MDTTLVFVGGMFTGMVVTLVGIGAAIYWINKKIEGLP